MIHKIILAISLLTFALTLFAWNQVYLHSSSNYVITVGKKQISAGEVRIGNRDCIIAVRNDAIAIDCE